jgi:hypothetical protein
MRLAVVVRAASAGVTADLDPGSTPTRTVADYAELSGIDGMAASAEVDVDPDGRARVTVRATAPAATTFLHFVGLVAPEMDAEAAASVERAAPG